MPSRWRSAKFLDRRAQSEIPGFFGLLEWDDDYDYKAARR